MNKCSAVIGSQWGDEGKGHQTDILCNGMNTLNVRFNGGAQASHTVVTPNGKRHAFRSIGAGTFVGAKTYLSSYFIVNLPAFYKEYNEFSEKFLITPCIYVNPNCIVTTLWDVYINQAIETLRGSKRHGSCGFGINETVQRSKIDRYKITVFDLLYKKSLRKKLLIIQNEYVSKRLKDEYNLDIKDLPALYQKSIKDPENIDMFLYFADEFIKVIQIREDSIITKFDNVVFEGAQGLLLDQNNKEYLPNLTTSNTGIKNVMDILKNIHYNDCLDVYYMSRCYLTKHGAGMFKNELGFKPYLKINDMTNVENEFQGALRYGYLNFDLLISQIQRDLQDVTSPVNINVTFTCFDEVDEDIKYIENGCIHSIKKSDFFKVAYNILKNQIPNLHNIYITNGPTRKDYMSFM